MAALTGRSLPNWPISVPLSPRLRLESPSIWMAWTVSLQSAPLLPVSSRSAWIADRSISGRRDDDTPIRLQRRGLCERPIPGPLMVSRLYVALAISKAYLHSLSECQLLKLHQSRPMSAQVLCSDPHSVRSRGASLRPRGAPCVDRGVSCPRSKSIVLEINTYQ